MGKKILALLIAHLFAIPAWAQSDVFRVQGSVSVGGIAVDDGDAANGAKLHEYRDLSNGLLTGIDLRGRSSRYWLDFFGENLGRDDTYASLRGGMYDVFKYRFSSDSLRHNFLFNGRTPYAGAGGPAQTATFPQLDPNTWNSLDVGYKRRNDAGYFELQALSPWYFRADANQVTSSGSKIGSSSQGLSPGNGFVDLAFPVEYRTRNATFETGYNSKTVHAALSWMTSKFENENESVTWTNGFLANGIDRSFLGAGNEYSRLAGNVTFRRLPLGSTLALRFTRDELESDVGLATTVLNTAGAIAQTNPNVSTFQGRIENRTFSAALASAPMRSLDTRLYYNRNERNDKSTHVEFSGALGTFDNEPFSYKKDRYGFDAFYRINRGNRLGAGFEILDTKREGRFDFDDSEDQRWFVEWKNTSMDELAARLKYTRLERDSNFLLAGSGTGTGDVNYMNRYLTAFDVSNLEQDQLKVTLDYSPLPLFDVSFEGILKRNKFKDNTLGRLKDDRREIYVSASYGEPGGPRLTVFGDAELIKYDSRHRVATGTAVGAYDPFAPPTGTAYNWEGQVKDRNWAAGLALHWPLMERLTLKASAIYYKTDGSVDLALQEGVPASVVRPVPLDLWDDSRRTSLTIRADYALGKSWMVTGGYAYEKFEYRDAQTDGYRYTVPAANRADSYVNGYFANPQYTAHIVYALVTYRF